MQLMTGTTTPAETKIVVVDVDGVDGDSQWRRLCNERCHFAFPDTWITQSGSGAGYHVYFKLPEGIDSCESGIIFGIWDTTLCQGRGGWKSRSEIRILADRSLVVSPPSLHVRTGEEYMFRQGYSPKNYPEPIIAPDWLLAMPRLKPPVFHQENSRPLYQPKQKELPDHQYSRVDVLDAVSDQDGVASVARNWGVVFTGPLSWKKDWIPCFVPGREDPNRSNPSGSFNCDSGCLYDFTTGLTMSFFDVGVATGQFATWQDCCNHLGEIYIGAKK